MSRSCKSQAVAYSVFHYWRKKYGQGDLPVGSQTSFIPVLLDHGHDRELVLQHLRPVPYPVGYRVWQGQLHIHDNGGRNKWHYGYRNSPKLLALYHRNDWPNMAEIPGTMATELASKMTTANMVKSLKLIAMESVDKDTMLRIFEKFN